MSDEFGFIPDDEKSLGFVPDKSPELLPASPAAEQSADRTGEAALQGFGQGATFGFLPWLQARAEQVIKGGEQAIDGFQRVDPGAFARGLGNVAQGALSTTGLGPLVGLTPNTPEFEISRQQFAAREKGLEKQHPGISAVSNVAGSILNPVTLATGGGGMMASKGLGQAMAQGAKFGLATGAAQGAGDVASEGLQGADALGRLAAQTGMGAVGGGIGGGTAYGIGKAAGAVKDNVFAPIVARYMGLNKGVSNKLEKTGMLPDVIQQGADSGVIKAFSGLESTAARNDALKSSLGGELDDIYSGLTKAGATPTGTEVAQVYKGMMNDAVARGEASSIAPLATKLDDFIAATKALQAKAIPADTGADDAAAQALALPMELKQVSQLAKQPLGKAKADELAKIPTRQPSASVKTLSDAYSNIKRFIEEKAAAASPELATALAQTNRKYGMAQDLAAMLADRGARDSANKSFPWSTMVLPVLGGAIGGGKGYYDDPTGLGAASGAAMGIAGGMALSGAPGRAGAIGAYKAANLGQKALQSSLGQAVGAQLGADGVEGLGELLFGTTAKPATPPGTDDEEKKAVASRHFVGAQ